MSTKCCEFYKIPCGSMFIFDGQNWVKTNKVPHNSFRVSDGSTKYFYVNETVEVIQE